MELSITEAAALLGRSVRTVRAQVARGELPGVKRGGQWFIPKAALPLTEPQRAALQDRADSLRNTLEDALPARLAHTPSQRRGLADLDAFRVGAVLLGALRAAPPGLPPGLDLGAVCRALEQAVLDIAEAAAQYDREARRVALVRARAGLGRAQALLLLGAGLRPQEPVDSWLATLEGSLLPAVAGFARWAERPPQARR